MVIVDKDLPVRLQNRLRVLHIGPLPPPMGGMSTVLMGLSAALQSHCETQVFSNSKTTEIDRSLSQAITAQLKLSWQLKRTLQQWRPDIVHIHTCSNFTFWRNGLDLMLANCFGCKTVLHIHGACFHQFLGSLNTLLARLARALLGSSDCVIVLGQIWQERMTLWCRSGSIKVIANGVEVPNGVLGACVDGIAHIVCVANFEPRKGLDDLIRAAANLPTTGKAWRISFLGAKLDLSYEQSLQQLTKDLGVEDRVNFVGPVSLEQVSDYLSSAYLFCLPSHDEGLPMSMLEAMAHAIPIVATTVGAIPEAVDDGVEAFLYQAGNSASLTIVLARLLETPALALHMGENARSRLIRDFSLETMSQRVFTLYQQMSS